MSATKLNINWDIAAQVQAVTVGQYLFSRIGGRPPEGRCPYCDSIIYTRRHRLCGVCGEKLPAVCLFTPSEAERVETSLQKERERHRVWLEKRERADDRPS